MAATEESLRKTLTFVFSIIGIIIFYVVISTKIRVMADETKSRVLKKAAEDDWENFLEKRSGGYMQEDSGQPPEEESLPPSE